MFFGPWFYYSFIYCVHDLWAREKPPQRLSKASELELSKFFLSSPLFFSSTDLLVGEKSVEH